MKLVWQCLFSPRLYKIYRHGPRETLYEPQGLEKHGDKILSSAKMILNIGIYTSPFIFMYIYKRGFFSLDETRSLLHIFGGIGCLLVIALIMRGVGRASNKQYVEFINAISDQTQEKKSYLKSIRKYDFEFYAWPVAFTVAPSQKSSWLANPFASCANANLPAYQRVPIQILAFIAIHTFALRLIYPGSLGLVKNLLWSALFQGRTQLVEDFNGQRAKIVTADGNSIDTMYVDNLGSPKRDTLVICCEGNSGFYEIGIMLTPIKAGYSALGWNRPGFAESTGTPYPLAEQNAMDACMQYAINELGYLPENIVMFGWSIGGYTATWAAVNYPVVQALILDATFDDLLPLARNQMPASWSLLVKEVVRSYVDLNVAELIRRYDGPVKLVRRTEDEIICLRQGMLSTNRGNYLMMKLVEARHGNLTQNVIDTIQTLVELMDSQRAVLQKGDESDQSSEPLELISKYLHDYKSSHCTPLPEADFNVVMDSLIMTKTN